MSFKSPMLQSYVALLMLFMPITSVLIIPSVQGTTPGYILSFLALPLVVLVGGEKLSKYMLLLFCGFLIWLCFFYFSLLSGAVWSPHLFEYGLVFIDQNDKSKILRSSFFTQSAYLLVVVLYGLFVYCFYNKNWDRWLKFGALFLSGYGIYEFVYFLLFHQSGDFLSNRMFGKDMNATGSAVETMVVAGVWLTRVKSLTGEPSMYAFTMMPFLFYANAMRWSLALRLIMTISVVLTASTSALLAALVGLFVSILHGRVRMRTVGTIAFVVALAFAFNYDFFMDLVNQVIIAKALAENFSGSDRMNTFGAAMNFWWNLKPLGQLFGVGFGCVRSTDFFSTILVNCGLLGLFGFLALFLYPYIRLERDDRSLALKQALLGTLVVMLVSVPEYAYLAPWTFLAMAYRGITKPLRHYAIVRK